MARFEVTSHEVWDRTFTRTVEAGSVEEAIKIAKTTGHDGDWKLQSERLRFDGPIDNENYAAKVAAAGK